MPASSMAVSISDAAGGLSVKKMNTYWASKLRYINPAPSRASSRVADAITRRPSFWLAPADPRMPVTARTQPSLPSAEGACTAVRPGPGRSGWLPVRTIRVTDERDRPNERPIAGVVYPAAAAAMTSRSRPCRTERW